MPDSQVTRSHILGSAGSTHRHSKRNIDGNWRAEICDLIYMMSQQPIDVLNLKESQGELYGKPIDRGDYFAYGVIRFARHKTKIGIELEINENLADLWKWFVEFKRKETIKRVPPSVVRHSV